MEAKKSNIMRKLLSRRDSSLELVEAIRRSAFEVGKAYTVEVDGRRYVVKRERHSGAPKITKRQTVKKTA